MYFSIIIPTYNRALFLLDSIKSVLNQSFQDLEIIVVDDGSTDNTKDVVLGLNNSKIKYIYQENLERSAARNNGLKNTNGKYIVFLDSDDQLKFNCLELLATSIKDNGEPVAVFGLKCIFRNKQKIEIGTQFELTTNQTAINILTRTSTIPSYQCAHRNCFDHNLFNEKFTLWEDTHLWLRIIQQYPVFGVSDSIIHITIHEDSTVAKIAREVQLKDVHRYREAVLDLLNFSDLFPNNVYESIFRAYVYSKYQMYIYQARINGQFDISKKLLCEAQEFKFSPVYHYKTLIKLTVGRVFKLKIS